MARDIMTGAILVLAASIAMLVAAPISPTLPSMAEHFADTENSAFLTKMSIALPMLSIALAAPAIGWAIDRYGRKPFLVMGGILTAAAGSGGLYIEDLHALLAARMLMGVGISACLVTALTLAGDYFSGPARDVFFGVQSAFMAVFYVVVMFAAGALAALSWHGPHALYVFGLVIAGLAFLLPPEPARAPRAASLQTDESASEGKLRLYAAAYGVTALYVIVNFMFPSQLPFHLANHGIDDPRQIALVEAISQPLSAVSALSFALLRQRLNFGVLLALALAGLGAGCLMVAGSNSILSAAAANGVAALSAGLVLPNINAMLVSAASGAARGRVVSGLAFVIFMSQFLSPVLLEPAVSAFGVSGAFAFAGWVLIVLGLAWAGGRTAWGAVAKASR